MHLLDVEIFLMDNHFQIVLLDHKYSQVFTLDCFPALNTMPRLFISNLKHIISINYRDQNTLA